MGRCIAILMLGVLAGAAGCRNGNCYNGNCSAWRPGSCLMGLAGPSTIAPPATYSLQIPGTANQNYYQPGTPALQGANGAWGTQPASPVSAQQASAGPTTPAPAFASPQVAASGQFQQVAVAPTAWPGGSGRVISPDFATTRIDERCDPSRLPVADATGVRLPHPVPQYQPANGFAATSMPVMGNPGYSIPNAVQQPGQTQWTLQTNPYQPAPQQPQWVLAESSTRDLSRDPNYQAGWRDRVPQQGPISR